MADWKTLAGRGALKAARWSGLAGLAARATKPFGAIFTLHHVSPDPHETFLANGHLRITPDFLGALILHLKASGYDLVDLAEAVRRIEARRAGATGSAGRADRPFAAFTLDDGYCNNLTFAAPVFRREAVPYAIFVSPGLADGTILPWWEVVEKLVRDNPSVLMSFGAAKRLPSRTPAEKRRAFDALCLHLTFDCAEPDIDGEVRRLVDLNGGIAADPASRVMDWKTLQRLAEDPLCTIGAHSMTHPRLSRIDACDALLEIRRSGEEIGERLGRRPDFFAYPYGSRDACGPREFEMARQAGYRASFTTRLHALSERTAGDLHALPRLSLNGYYQDESYVDVLMSGLPGVWKDRNT